MTALIDLDSILYQSVYRIVSFGEMRSKLGELGKEAARQWLMEEVYNEGINRCENELLKMKSFVNDVFFEEITSYELFITTCTKSFRKDVAPSYKANRRRNNYVWMLREHYKMNGANHSDTLEADDLISIRAKELGFGNYIIFSIDKDLKQIGGYFWSYYKVKSKDMYGKTIVNEFGIEEREYRQKTVEFISKEKAEYLFWQQMLMGDPSDNIKGIKGLGPKKSEKILVGSTKLWVTCAREYIKANQKKDWKINYQLLKLK